MSKQSKIHLYIRGNCGNQFFQYAFAREIQEKIGGELIINYSKVRNSSNSMAESDNLLKEFNTVPYKYENNIGFGGLIFKALKLFHILGGLKTFEKKTYIFFLKCAKFLPYFGIYYFDAAYYPFKFIKRRNIFINGYFESPQYFTDIDERIVEELKPKKPELTQNEELYNIINNFESVCVTLKRRDTENPKYSYSLNYYYSAIDYLCKRLSNPVFIIFSDDIEWCKRNIQIDAKVYYETKNNPIWEKIRLMSGCKHFVIYNSTFSWWAQHLSTNKDKIVVAPSKWMQRDDQPIDIYEDGWVYLTPRGDVVCEHE